MKIRELYNKYRYANTNKSISHPIIKIWEEKKHVMRDGLANIISMHALLTQSDSTAGFWVTRDIYLRYFE